MVVLPEKGFWSDGWIDGRAAEVEGPALADLSSLSWEIKREEAPTYYRLQFMNKVWWQVALVVSFKNNQ